MEPYKKLVSLRKATKKSQRTVANELGIPPSLMSMYESGTRNPSDANKLKLAEYYGTTVGYIFFDEDVTN